MNMNINTNELRAEGMQNVQRIREIREACESENRLRSESEEREYQRLVSRNQEIGNMIQLEERGQRSQRTPIENTAEIWRRCADTRTPLTIRVQRDIMVTDGLAGTGLLPVQEKDFLKPLREGLIWDKVGIQIQAGLVGQLRWPIHSKATASWEGETSRLADSHIDFSALTMQGNRLGLAIPVSQTELNDTRGKVEAVVREEMPAACSDLINESMLTLYGEYKDGATIKDKKVYGPFAQWANDQSKNCEIKALGASITRKGLLDMKAAVAATGIKITNGVYIMNEVTKAALEDTKVDAGSGRFVCENDRVLGYPVFTSNQIPEGVVCFGDFGYQAAGFFGDISMVVDPYTLVRQFSTDFVLNMRFGTARLRKEAFVVGMTTSAKSAFDTKLATLKRS